MKYKVLIIILLTISCHFLWSQTKETDLENSFKKAQDFHYINKDSAYHYYEKTISLANAKNNLDYLFMGYTYLINANGHYYDLVNYRRNIEREELVLLNDKRVDDFEWADYYRSYLLFDKGNYHYKAKSYASSKKYFLQLYSKIEALPTEKIFVGEIDMLSSINSFLGLINYHTGRYEQAEIVYRRNIELVTKHADSLDGWQSSVMSSKKLLSQVYEVQNKYEDANLLLKEALEFYSIRGQDPQFKNSHLSTLMLLAKSYNEQGDYQRTIELLSRSDLLRDNLFSREIYSIAGDAHLGQENFLEALKQYEAGLAVNLQYRQDKPHQDVANAYGKLVELYINQGQFENGFKNLQLAFNYSGFNIEVNSIQKNPRPQEVFSKRQLLHLLDLKLQLLQIALYQTEKNQDYLDAAIETNHSILRTFDLLKREFESKLDKQFLAETVYPIFNRMLEITYSAYRRKPSPELFTLALNIAEKNKDFILLEALRNADATTYGNIPKTILEKEARYRAKITELEKSIFDDTNEGTNFSVELSGLKEEYYTFLDSIKIQYPEYHFLKYQDTNLDLNAIRSQLVKKDDLLISFTLSGENLYAIIFDKTREDFIKMVFNEKDKKEVKELYRLMSKPSIANSDKELEKLATRLFDKVLKRPLQGFQSRNLTVFPDDVLHYLPLDVLRQDDEYLIHKMNISYANSLTSLLELKKKDNIDKKQLLAFAPSFDDEEVTTNERKFGKLLYNGDEVRAIETYFKADSYFDHEATLNNFIENAPRSKTIHLATHASANDEFPDFSYLAFTKDDDSSASNILYIKDLYNTNLSADMVVLSACQTGIGKLKKGQGMMSLSKGFYYAGAKSLVNTLWKINDKSTVKLIEFFYEGLSKGKSKTEALRQAKLKYLASTDDELLKHPYYWAAFTVSGDASPISNDNTIWGVIGLGIVLLVFTWIFSRKAKSSIKT